MALFTKQNGNYTNTQGIKYNLSGGGINLATPIVISTGTLNNHEVIQLDTNHYFCVYTDADGQGKCKIITVVNNVVTAGPTTVFSGSGYTVTGVSVTHSILIDTNKVFISFSLMNSPFSAYGMVATFDINTGIVICGTPVTFNGSTGSINLCKIDASTVSISFTDSSTSNRHACIIAQISGTTVSYGTKVHFVATASYAYSVFNTILVDTNKIVIVYQNSSQPRCIVGTISGNTVSFGTEVIFNPASTNTITSLKVSINKILITYVDSGNSSYGTAIVGDVSGNAITFGSEYTFTAASTSSIVPTYLSDNTYLLTYCYSSQTRNKIATISDNTVSFGAETSLDTVTGGLVLLQINSSKFAILYANGLRFKYINISGANVTYTTGYVFSGASTKFLYNTGNDFFFVYCGTSAVGSYNTFEYNQNTHYAKVKGMWTNVNGVWKRTFVDYQLNTTGVLHSPVLGGSYSESVSSIAYDSDSILVASACYTTYSAPEGVKVEINKMAVSGTTVSRTAGTSFNDWYVADTTPSSCVIKMVKVNSTRFLVYALDPNSGFQALRCFDLSGTTFTVGTSYNLGLATDADVVVLSDTKALLIYNGNYKVITIAADRTLTFGTAVSLGITGTIYKVQKYQTDNIIVPYKNGAGFIATMYWDTATEKLIMNRNYQITPQNVTIFNSNLLDSKRILFNYSYSGTNYCAIGYINSTINNIEMQEQTAINFNIKYANLIDANTILITNDGGTTASSYSYLDINDKQVYYRNVQTIFGIGKVSSSNTIVNNITLDNYRAILLDRKYCYLLY